MMNNKPIAAFLISRQITNTSLSKEVSTVLQEYRLPIMTSYTTQRIVYAKSAANGHSVFDECNIDAINEITKIVHELKELCI